MYTDHCVVTPILAVELELGCGTTVGSSVPDWQLRAVLCRQRGMVAPMVR
jgi:hypothetical protein